MTSIRNEKKDGLLIVTMSRGKANALNAAMVEELTASVAEAAADDVRGLVLASGCPNFFSAGFDAKEVFAYDRETMTAYFGAYIDLYDALFHLPKPVVGALSGHAMAGGAVLALACDVRVMAEGPFRFALNEINLGVVLSPGVVRMAVDAIGPRHARELFLEGESLTPARAKEIGLAAELAQPEKVLERAVARAHSLAEKPRGAFGIMKRTLIEVSGHPPLGSGRQHLGRFIDQWFTPECIERRQVLTLKLSAISYQPSAKPAAERADG
jgi:enoyl-CoA hydratase/carnithine racemase